MASGLITDFISKKQKPFSFCFLRSFSVIYSPRRTGLPMRRLAVGREGEMKVSLFFFVFSQLSPLSNP